MKYTSTILVVYLSLFLFGCQRQIDFPEPNPQTGSVTFWAKKSCSDNGIVFSIDTITDSITSFSSTAPACRGAGTKTIPLPAGTYTWKATCAGDTITGVVSVRSGDCLPVELVFNDPPSKGEVTFWAKKSCSPSSPIFFSVNDVKDSITRFSADEPACGSADAKTIQLPVGTYLWKAICSADTLSGQVSVNKDECTRVYLSFPDHPIADTEYIKFKVNGDEGIFNCPPAQVTEADYTSNFTSIQIFGSYKGQPDNWYGILIKGPDSESGIHIASQLKLPGITAGMSDTLKVDITTFGAVGQWIGGNLKGKIRDDASNSVVDVEMEFKVKRKK